MSAKFTGGRNLTGDPLEGVHPVLVSHLTPLRPWLYDERKSRDVSEICINGAGDVWIEKGHGNWERLQMKQLDGLWAKALLGNLANALRIDFDPETSPKIRASLPGGHRLAGLVGAACESEFVISIRRRHRAVRRFEDFGIGEEMQGRLAALMESGGTIMISGPAYAGKTTLLNLIAGLIPKTRRVATIEDSREVFIDHPNQINLLVDRFSETPRFGYLHALDSINSLRIDTVICQELSQENAAAALRLMNMGQAGFLITGHADSALDMLDAWRTNIEMGRANKLSGNIVKMLARRLDAILHLGFGQRDDGTTGRILSETILKNRSSDQHGQYYLDCAWEQL